MVPLATCGWQSRPQELLEKAPLLGTAVLLLQPSLVPVSAPQHVVSHRDPPLLFTEGPGLSSVTEPRVWVTVLPLARGRSSRVSRWRLSLQRRPVAAQRSDDGSGWWHNKTQVRKKHRKARLSQEMDYPRELRARRLCILQECSLGFSIRSPM